MTEHYYSEVQTSRPRTKEIDVTYFGRNLKLLTGSGVFSIGKVDKGTELLITHCSVEGCKSILDLGCGYGIVGISLAAGYPDLNVLLTDVNKRALGLARKNIELNNINNATAVHADVFAGIDKVFDAILLNPPQSAGKELCFRMIEESVSHLSPAGSLQIVARKNKGGEMLAQKMQEVFGNISVLARKSGYWVYLSRRQLL